MKSICSHRTTHTLAYRVCLITQFNVPPPPILFICFLRFLPGAGLYEWGCPSDVALLEGRVGGEVELKLAEAPPEGQAMMNEVLETELLES